MVRLPCGSRSTARTRSPFSLRATARFRVDVVLATPPFWFANEMTVDVAVSPSSESEDSVGGRERRRNDIGASFGQSSRSPLPLRLRRSAEQTSGELRTAAFEGARRFRGPWSFARQPVLCLAHE